MKLRTNKNHQSGEFKESEYKTNLKIIFKIVAINVSCSLLTGLFAATADYSKEEHLATVSSSVRESIYQDNASFRDDFHASYGDEKEKYDPLITKEFISNIPRLKVDLSSNKDLSFLKDFNELKSLTLLNSQLLTKENIDIISNSNCKHLFLYFGSDKMIMKSQQTKIDLSSLRGKNVNIYLSSCSETYDMELFTYMTLLMLNNYDESWFKSSVDFEKYKIIDKRLDEIISSIELNDYMSDDEKIYNIMEAICKKIKYDPIVGREKKVKTEQERTDLVSYYNKYVLSSVLNNSNVNEQSNGLCSNYSAVFSAICQKLGIVSYYVTGVGMNSKAGGHAWNLVEFDNYYKYVDITALDSYHKINEIAKKINPESEAYDLKSMAFYDFDNYSTFNDFYKVDTDIKFLVEENYIEPVYYNEGLEDNVIHNKIPSITKDKMRFISYVGTLGVDVVLLITTIFKRKKIVSEIDDFTREEEYMDLDLGDKKSYFPF